jgi:hypothetical protein
MDDQKQESALDSVFSGLLAAALIIFCVVAFSYFLRFGVGNYSLSKDGKDWAEFGEYMGGTLGGFFGLFAFIGLLITIAQQRADNKRTVKATLDAVTAAHQLQTKSRRSSMLAIVDAANEHARRIEEALGRSEERASMYGVYHKSIIDGVVRALTDIPVHEVGNRDAILALLSLRDQFVFLGVAMEAYMAGPAKDPLVKQGLDSLMEPDGGPQRKALLGAAEKVLVSNVRVHFAEIRKNYQAVETAVKMPDVL